MKIFLSQREREIFPNPHTLNIYNSILKIYKSQTLWYNLQLRLVNLQLQRIYLSHRDFGSWYLNEFLYGTTRPGNDVDFCTIDNWIRIIKLSFKRFLLLFTKSIIGIHFSTLCWTGLLPKMNEIFTAIIINNKAHQHLQIKKNNATGVKIHA